MYVKCAVWGQKNIQIYLSPPWNLDVRRVNLLLLPINLIFAYSEEVDAFIRQSFLFSNLQSTSTQCKASDNKKIKEHLLFLHTEQALNTYWLCTC